MSKTIYIAGPMRGRKLFNFPAFDAAEALLKSQGWNVLSPAQLDRAAGFDPEILPEDYDWCDLSKIGFDLREAVRRDTEAIQIVDAIYMLQGWEKSTGATAERALAKWLGLQVIEQREGSQPRLETIAESCRIIFYLNGPPGCGKDSIGQGICDALRTEVQKLAFKSHLYVVTAAIVGMDLDDFVAICTDRETKDRRGLLPSGPFGNDTPRDAMIFVSERVIKPSLGKSFFGNIAAMSVLPHPGVTVFTDSGFSEEIARVHGELPEAIHVLVRIHRDGCSFEGDSRSHLSMGSERIHEFDIQNNGSIDEAVELTIRKAFESIAGD